ncbi:MAG: phosphoribosyl-ATP diphosphatase [Alphaproteobacteria bacterium RIFCSPLOWO2_01_FULL_40_26]|nr:MAG: phosphoribosyl-ATP diphosphatase [Alphaproteobacteria bacterium RIFCSPHIGHO2_02_FULL_40_34]OFW88457.1 MAG: phosphoribosyl-ATP diphosphatase [Alphaproteobacteria bacterium RIFCSPHIGHO2_01_FULL_40_8]OFW94833.1 MAG: phosphoribosyl-ATP diphosphatase [Alphaproteobacteria bacterium RIFCSPLOWO2_01_FULL_40_26]OFX10459.1 MAG: phosphoribosyl-ATP diphosphatase [Alphaproteobacteria bacterium RIFCSPLOWO2_02_FULL_40_19]OFX11033.1 MAG: phosphoribosyl-ATP diphosphatase [Alphaproteobacteria bacterium RI
MTIEELFNILKQKISAEEKNSYTYELVKGGVEKITRKIGEEALEVVIASFIHQKNSNTKTRKELIGEVCDLFYHTLVLLTSQQIEFDEVLKELHKRNKNRS